MPSFKEAFAAARKAGKKEFSWNGNRYNTKLKEEVSAAPKKSLKPVGRGGRPSVDSSGPSKPSGDTVIKHVRGVRAGTAGMSAKDAKADRSTPVKPAAKPVGVAPRPTNSGRTTSTRTSPLVEQAREVLAASRAGSVARTQAAMERERKKLAALKK